jgi:protein-histidine N-methyltransferase
MAFSFGFSGDDIEEDPNDVPQPNEQELGQTEDVPPPISARTHDLDEMVGMRTIQTSTS